MATFLDTITDGVIILDTQWRFVFINDLGARIFDKTQEELIGKNVYDIWIEANNTVFRQNCQSAVDNSAPTYWQQFSISLNTWLEFYAYPSENGLVLLTHSAPQLQKLNTSNSLEYQLLYQTVKLPETNGAALNQMIQHLIAEAALRHTNAQLAKILESITDGVIALDDQWRYTFVNEKAIQILQKYEGELLGKNIWQVYPELINTPLYQKCHEVADTGTSVQFDYYYPQLNLWLEHNIYRSVNGISIYFQDITQRKQIEAERHELFEREQNARIQIELAEQKYAFLSEAGRVLATSLLSQTTLSTVVRLVVPFLADFCLVQKLGNGGSFKSGAAMHCIAEKQKLVDELVSYYSHTRNPTSLTAKVIQSREPILISEFDYSAVTSNSQDEELLHIYQQLNPKSCMIVPLIACGQIFGTLFLATSESERRYTESDLVLAVDLACRAAMAIDNSQLYHQAQESNRLKDEFLATMSHEIRTPLHAILGWAQTLARRNITDSAVQKGVETIERNGKNLMKIVSDLLDVSRIIKGKLYLDTATVDFAIVTQEAISSLQLAAEAKSIHIETHIEQNINPVRGDTERLRQIVWNLISNAIKFTPQGGNVTVRLFQQQYVQLEVSDTGQGIRASFLPYIYDRFRQADGSFTRVHGGLGNGLFLVRHLVEMHGGTIDIYSAGEGQGTTATLRLPISFV